VLGLSFSFPAGILKQTGKSAINGINGEPLLLASAGGTRLAQYR